MNSSMKQAFLTEVKSPSVTLKSTRTAVRPKQPEHGWEPTKTVYQSRDIQVPADYLRSDPHDARPIEYQQIDFAKTVLPEFDGGYAVILDYVLSPSECAKLIQLAESSVVNEDKVENGNPWQPALVNIGGGYEVLQASYRNSDRIIWDQQEIVDRLWARMEKVPEIQQKLGRFNEIDLLGARKLNGKPGMNWDFHRVNKRLRFLKYGPGQFFRPHCDGAYTESGRDDDKVIRTHFTLHLYLNDSKAQGGDDADLEGGATSFLSSDELRKLDVDPKAGRVLIFQHQRLYHSGDDVKAGTKYTVRTDIMYELKRDE